VLKRKSQLKTNKPLKSKTRLKSKSRLSSKKKLGAGKKTKEWNTVRQEIYDELSLLGINSCEGHLSPQCTGNFALGLAHSKKRREIKNDNEFREVALLCVKCHEHLEYGDKDIMEETIKEIIKNRII
jgi:hypothetical protein